MAGSPIRWQHYRGRGRHITKAMGGRHRPARDFRPKPFAAAPETVPVEVNNET